MFRQRLDSTAVDDIAKAMMDGFNRHDRLFRAESARVKHRFETRDWATQQRAQRERIEFYDLRVRECLQRLVKEDKADQQPMEVCEQVKLHDIGLLVNHHQPELAETLFNLVTTKTLQRAYFQNDFIFVRPAVSTEYIEDDEHGALPTYRSYYPPHDTMHHEVRRMVEDFDLRVPCDDLGRDAGLVLEAMRQRLSHHRLRANFQIQALSGLFYRYKGAYLVGKTINGLQEVPFALPILHNENGRLFIEAVLFGEDDLLMLFSFARADFMVDMEVPSAYVLFLPSLMPRKPRAEFNNAIMELVAANIFPGDMLWKNFGITRHGKVVFYDDESEYITDHHFRRVPPPREEEEEMSGEIWYLVGPKDVFPETFAPFLLGNPLMREDIMKLHADLLGAAFWQAHQKRIADGHVSDVFPHERARRLRAQAHKELLN